MLWLQQEQKRKESITEQKPKKGLVFEISSDDGFQICAESIEGEWLSLPSTRAPVAVTALPRRHSLVEEAAVILEKPEVLQVCVTHMPSRAALSALSPPGVPLLQGYPSSRAAPPPPGLPLLQGCSHTCSHSVPRPWLL